uniref:Ubiquitin-like protease family profile domain-containing protein n=1 Tax=Lactuca sativa TaxID=4236 RepID=A0A9R1WM93_LACSA|nr:hypothetical protein LSAT_V11C100013050 [Lactuca sativa]
MMTTIFVNPPPVTMPIQKIAKKQTKIEKPRNVEDSLRCLNTRFPPEHITKTMTLLNKDQQRCVQSIGFGSALNMQLEKLPHQRLLVKRERVHEVYGIPMGDIPMSNRSKANSENKVVKLWKSQFPKTIKRIRLTHVIDMIVKDTNAGPFFIMNFLVLFVSVMIEYSTMGTVNQGFLENIPGDMDIKQLDWWGFVVLCLKSGRKMWKPLDDKYVYTGPIVFLLDGTIQSPTAGMIHWTTDMLKGRELEELSKGGFGNVTISLQHMNMNRTEQEDNYKTEDGEDDDVVGSERDCISPDGFIGNVVQETSENDADNNFKKFPDSVELRMLVTKRNHEFNLAWPDFSTSNDSDEGTNSNGTTTPVMHYQQNTTIIKDDQFQESTMVGDDDAVDDVVCTPFTQILNEDNFDMLLESTLATSIRHSSHQSLTHSDQHEPNIKNDDVNPVPATIVAPRRSRRLVQLTDKIRSPHYRRAVDPKQPIKSIEERVDLVFETMFGDSGPWRIFESMIPGSKIHGTIIDIWATILNHLELRRNKKSPARMFLSCTLLSNFILDEAICIEQRYKMFVDRMNEHIEKFKQCTSFNDVDLVFSSVLENDHYYLIVFDFKKSECVIIDNIYSEESIEVIYGNVPNDLKILFTLYIDALNHPKRNSIKHAVTVRLYMAWMTKMNYIDCGVFVLRHMETYKGEDLDKWNVGLEPEFPDNDDQQMQLNELEKSCKVLLIKNINI